MHASEAQTRSEGESSGSHRDRVADLPPSAKLVYKVLEYDDSLSQRQIADETLLPPRTVRYALSRLEEVGAVRARFSFSDARKRLYSLDTA